MTSAPPGAHALPLWSDAAAFSAAFLQLPAAPPWAAPPQSRWPYLAHAPPGLADALLAPPPWPPKRHPLGPFEVAAALRAHHAQAAAQPPPPAAAAARPPAAPAPTQPARPGAARVYSRQQLLALKPALTPRPPELEGHPAALDDAAPRKATPPVPAATPQSPAVQPASPVSTAAPPATPPAKPPAPPGPARYTAAALLRLRHAVATPPSPAVLAAAAALEGVTQPAAAAPPAPAARPSPTAAAAVAAPLPPLPPPGGLWTDGEAEPPAGSTWREPSFLEDLAALPAAAAALAPPPAASAALRFAPSAALPAFCAHVCAAMAKSDGDGEDLLRWALLRGRAATAGAPALVTSLQLLPRCDAAAALAALHSDGGADGDEVVGWAACTLGAGAFLPGAARGAFAARPPGARREAPAALLACVDALRGAHGPACIECFDLRTGAPLAFQLQHAA